MRAFVIRPFRSDSVRDFEPHLVQSALIGPALEQTGYVGSTSDAITDSGSVPERMILEIVNADLVIADITIDNANVFYELGVRHALRPAGTILIRAASDPAYPSERVPFDVQGWSYVSYPRKAPEASLDQLVRTIRTARSAGTVDSPVFRLFPDLRIETFGFDRVPDDLLEEIARYRRDASAADLRLLAEDVLGLRYELPALREIALAQSSIDDSDGAMDTWESVRIRVADDFQANRELGNLYSRLDDDPTRSDRALKRPLTGRRTTKDQRSELLAQLARNRKDEWRRSWESLTQEGDIAEAQRAALRSPKLDEAIDTYASATMQDPGDYYPAINALALVTVQAELAAKHAETWRLIFPTDDDAESALDRRAADRRWLTAATASAIEAQRRREAGGATHDDYVAISSAELQLLTATDPCDPRIGVAFQRAVGLLGPRPSEAVARQLSLYRELGVLQERCAPVEQLFRPDEPSGDDTPTRPIRVIVFSGHSIDRPDRETPRFPETAIGLVAHELDTAIDRVKAEGTHDLVGFASGSSGGDLLFHEACTRAGFPTEMFLTVPDAEYRGVGITDDAVQLGHWVDRFNVAFAKARTVHVLDHQHGQPTWRDTGPEDPLWGRWIRWVFHHARLRATRGDVKALVVWDGQTHNTGRGVFGFMQAAQRNGVGVETIQLAPLLHATGPEPGVR